MLDILFIFYTLADICYYHIRKLRCIRPYLDSSTACTIATSIIDSKLDYCNSRYYYKLSKSQLSYLQQIQNFLARNVIKAHKSCPITPIHFYCTTMCMSIQNKINKAFVDIGLRPRCAIPPPPSRPIGRITCVLKFSEYYLRLPGILNDPFSCMTLLAIE